jgi:hypothetical protein
MIMIGTGEGSVVLIQVLPCIETLARDDGASLHNWTYALRTMEYECRPLGPLRHSGVPIADSTHFSTLANATS